MTIKLSKFVLAAAVVFAGYSSSPAIAGENNITEHQAKKFLQQLRDTVNNQSADEAYDFLNLRIANYSILGTERLTYDNNGYLLNNVNNRNNLSYRRYPDAPFGQYNPVGFVDFTKDDFISSVLEKKARIPNYAMHINVENVQKLVGKSAIIATIDLRETSAVYSQYRVNNVYESFGKANWASYAHRQVDSIAKCNVRLENHNSGMFITRMDCDRI